MSPDDDSSGRIARAVEDAIRVSSFARERGVFIEGGVGESAASRAVFALGLHDVDPDLYSLDEVEFELATRERNRPLVMWVAGRGAGDVIAFARDTTKSSGEPPTVLAEYNGRWDQEVQRIREAKNHGLDVPRAKSLPLDDAATWAVFSTGEAKNVYDLNDARAAKFAGEVKPTSVMELAVFSGIFRPGFMANGSTNKLIDRRRAGTRNPHIHPELDHLAEPILTESAGIPVFRDQITNVIQEVAGLGPIDATRLGRSMLLNRRTDRQSTVEHLINGTVQRGHSAEAGEALVAWAYRSLPQSWSRPAAIADALRMYRSAWLHAHLAAGGRSLPN